MLIKIFEDGKIYKLYAYKKVECDENLKRINRTRRTDKGKLHIMTDKPRKKGTIRNDTGKLHIMTKTRKDKGGHHIVRKTRSDKGKPRPHTTKKEREKANVL